jgi:hypothetical protein
VTSPNVRWHDLNHTRSMLLISCSTQSTLVQYLLGRASITITLERYSHWIPVHGKARRRGYGRGLGVVTPVTGEFEATQETRVVRSEPTVVVKYSGSCISIQHYVM